MKEKKIIKGIQNYFNKNKIKKAVIGISGGLDSALSAYLAKEALGNNTVMGLIMPEKGVTLKKDIEDALDLCKKLRINYKIVEINRFVEVFSLVPWQKNKIADINLRARIRAVILYNFANANDALVIGTSNKTELTLGYFTKYGDGACDLEVIGSLYKTEVIEMAKEVGLPKNIIDKTPTAGLYIGQTDEKELGGKYKEIDNILKTKKFNSSLGKKLKERVEKNRHKRELPTVIK